MRVTVLVIRNALGREGGKVVKSYNRRQVMVRTRGAVNNTTEQEVEG
jgi:hypothetical protein